MEAEKAATQGEAFSPRPGIHPSLRISGMKLASISQSNAYRAIRSRKAKAYKGRERTNKNIKRVQQAVRDRFGFTPVKDEVWKALRHKDLQREEKYFLWMTMHDAYMVGSNWQRSGYKPEFQERAICKKCGVLETMEHLLTECEQNGQKTIWEQTGKLWEKKGFQWEKPNFGTILGCGMKDIRHSGQGKLTKGTNRLYRILIASSARLIWLLRNEVVIQEKDGISENEIRNRWLNNINRRLTLDIDMSHPKFERKALLKALVRDTWSGLIENEDRLGTDWTTASSGVLVGMPS
ncbi:hypothetical protein PQX77_006273 [Marasmius sp. AFHP31]|nr:hypothetical protein PQX77_006273 [Marasmius sp. AFHP31]